MGSGCGCLIADCSFVCQTTPHFGSTSRKASYSVRGYDTPNYSICKDLSPQFVHFLPNTRRPLVPPLSSYLPSSVILSKPRSGAPKDP